MPVHSLEVDCPSRAGLAIRTDHLIRYDVWKTRRAGIPTWKNETMPILSLYRDDQE